MLSSRTRVAVVGAGPAGLLLAHLLSTAGIDTVVVDRRQHADLEQPGRTNMLEQAAKEVLDTVPGSRVHTLGHRHDGFEVLFDGSRHHIDLAGLVGQSVWQYPQHEVLTDLIEAATQSGTDLRFGIAVTSVDAVATAQPRVLGVSEAGEGFELLADFVVGADGSRSVVRSAVEAGAGRPGIFRGYPFAWYGVLAEAPPSTPQQVYAKSEDGFALIGSHTSTMQRMYFQCEPGTQPSDFDDAAVWQTLKRRARGIDLTEGRIVQRDVLRSRSFVSGAMRFGRAALVGDAAHAVPATAGKAMNLAIADVALLSEALVTLYRDGDDRGIERYEEVALRRVWRAQQFSWWMTQMLHSSASDSPFEQRRRHTELRDLLASHAGRTYLAEQYAGQPFERLM